jgi:DNA (cytosine-5)-methyltransferase 1
MKKYRFIDLFAGIGGFHLAFEALGAECVYSNDYDKFSQITYKENFGKIDGKDIHLVNEKDIPKFDILCGGFPCQPFSIAGVSKKNSMGRKHGFDDEKQGNLFFEIIRIVNYHKPPVLFLENVKNLKSHDKGRTWKVIEKELDSAGYYVFPKVVDAKSYVPQHRERVFIICFRKDEFPNIEFQFPTPPKSRDLDIKDILEKSVDEKYTLSDKLWGYLQKHKENSKKKGNGFGFGLVDPAIDKDTRTMSARYHKDGSEILIKQKGKNPRRLTPRECARLQGFPESFKIPVSNTQAYRQFGNSVAIPAIQATAKQIFKTLEEYKAGGARKEQNNLFEK